MPKQGQQRFGSDRDQSLNDEEAQALRAAAESVARILDTLIPIPGTPYRIGLDPLLGLLPGVGDTVASLIGSLILVMAARLGAPRIVLARMGLNVVLNGVIGSIPGLGDIFSFWFRSNARNAALLRRVSAPAQRASTVSDWMFVVGLLAGTLSLVLMTAFGVIWAVARLWQFVTLG